ncbi:putative translin-associated protein X [Rosellinia necatrix]|uniref:Putative translin-associated protein X n=1 Tax=Rosellinia necatrix TaxID=77044 RepID=A0A1W2TBZ0_ROSNE|nr:putative translin-associated protein X [Rosellinia necatrix]
MSELIVPKKKEGATGAGVKRDYQGKEKVRRDGGPGAAPAPADHPRNAYTSMFESFRDELDEHHDRRTRIGKVSRDVTALSKKIVRKLSQPIPERIQSEIDSRLKEIAELLETIQPDVQGMNRHRYPLWCLEEFVEAVTFAHYLRHQTLMAPAAAEDVLPADIPLTAADYVFGVFDLTGEMMRFATAVTALSGSIPAGGDGGAPTRKDGDGDCDAAATADAAGDAQRTILTDMQDISSMLRICPPPGGRYSVYAKKLSIMAEQVLKVERLGYGVTVRGSERPKGWMPDLGEGFPGGGGDAEDIAMMD